MVLQVFSVPFPVAKAVSCRIQGAWKVFRVKWWLLVIYIVYRVINRSSESFVDASESVCKSSGDCKVVCGSTSSCKAVCGSAQACNCLWEPVLGLC